jgi:hypothetical protein
MSTRPSKLEDSKQEAYVLFVDLVKVLNLLNRKMMWKMLAKCWVPEPPVDVIVKSIEISTSVL